MKTLTLLITFLLGAVLYVGCNNSSPTASGNNDDCGDQTDKTVFYTSDSLLRKWPDNYIADSLRVYNLWIPVDSICSKEHISSTQFVSMFPYSFERPFYFKAAIEWSVLFSRSNDGFLTFAQIGSETQVDWTASVLDVGMAQSFGEGPADVFVNIYISFRTFGNAQQDSLYFVQRFRSAKQTLYYKYYKPSSQDIQSVGEEKRFKLAPGQDKKTFYPGLINDGNIYQNEIYR